MNPFIDWKNRMLCKEHPSILATGTKRWEGSPVIDYAKHLPCGVWTGTDIFAGDGVDIVADLQSINIATEIRFDGVFCCSTLEHIERPWTAVIAMGKVLNPGGALYLETHQTFPIHGYPNDYFRFSLQALKTMAFDARLTVTSSGYSYPCTIIPPEGVVWNPLAESYLNVSICATKDV